MNQKLLHALINRPVDFAKLLGWNLLTDLHNDWLKMLMSPHEDFALMAHRNSYKTTCLSIVFALQIVLRPDKTFCFCRKTDGETIRIIKQVQKMLETDVFRHIVRELYGVELELTTKTAYQIDTNLHQGVSGQVQLTGFGSGSNITGAHYDYAYLDDVETKEDRVSRAERERTKLFWMEMQNIVNRGGYIILIGTIWSDDGLFAMLEKKGFPIHRYTCYETGLMTDEQIAEKRASMDPDLYAANYELQIIASGDGLFPDAPRIYSGPATDIYNGKAHIDAAYGGEDYTAYTILRKNGSGWIGYGKIWHGHVDKTLDEIRAIHTAYRAGTVSVEKNADKGYLARDLRAKGFAVIEYQEKENKYIKIATYLRAEWRNIEWLPTTDPEYLRMICNYTEHAEHDDAPDSAASLIRAYGKTARIGNRADLLGY